ncbi:MAG: dihydroorotate dehydrogenase electron transfer subunit [Candidatus Nezhaarchaeota archaeon]|nr:dihydroorotate dehydrogenase electron transfer subunit [Candidatus Nezhaarchaeota archaeon]
MPAARILKVEEEGAGVATLFLEAPSVAVRARPGQFVMVWPEGGEEVPMSLSSVRPPASISITVKEVGETTRLLVSSRPGDVVGLRGPYGRGFEASSSRSILIGGGVGVAPLIFLAEEIRRIGGRALGLIAARSSRELVCRDRLRRVVDELFVATDDGSEGFKGLAHEALDFLLTKVKVDRVYVCGPEPMILKCIEVAVKHRVYLEACLERYIKCGVGLCGACVINGKRVCCEGPVFTLTELLGLKEIGAWRRDPSGRRVVVA